MSGTNSGSGASSAESESAAAQTSTPRSTIWQGFLGTASVVAYTVLFELLRNLVVNSFGENALVKVLDGTLQTLSVLVVVTAAGFVLYRFASGYRAKLRTAHELDLVAGLVAPGPALPDQQPRVSPPPPRQVAALNEHLVAAVLRDLPVHDYETAALLAVLTAIGDTPVQLPLAGEPSPQTAAMLLGELLRDGIVADSGAQRFCLRQVPEAPGWATVTAGPQWAAGLTALLHHYADRATRWAIALDSLEFAAGARYWFEAQEPYLRELVASCANPVAEFPVAAVVELVRLGDALDVWYARIGLGENGGGVARHLSSIPGLDELVLSRDLVLLRADELPQRPRGYRPRRLSTSLAARWEHYVALQELAAVPSDSSGAAARLETAWWLLPRDDVAGEVCALINLAVVHIRQGRLDAAQDRLELAEFLTRSGRDPDGRAQSHETMGTLWWARGEPRRALRCWQAALTGFRALDDDRGIGRCLQHLGSAIVVAPEHITLLLPEDPPLTRVEALRQATGWLAEARRRYPGAEHAEYYAAQARSALRASRALRGIDSSGRGALSEIDLWPRPLEDRARAVG